MPTTKLRNTMTILLLGSGGREHALTWKMLQSSLCTKLFVAPGNAGTAAIAINVNINILDFEMVLQKSEIEVIYQNNFSLSEREKYYSIS